MDKKNQEDPKQEKTLFDPENEIIFTSLRKPIKSDIFICKIVLKKFGKLEIHSLGKASERAVKIAEYLKRNEMAEVVNIKSFLQEMSDPRSQSGVRNELGFTVSLKKTSKFDELAANLKLN